MAPSGSTGRTTAASRRASQRAQPDTPSSDPARPPRRTAVANSPYASKEAPGKGKDKMQSPSKGKDKRTSKPAPPVKRVKKDRGAGKKQAASDDEGEAEDAEGQVVCAECQKTSKDATWVECDRCARLLLAFLSGRVEVGDGSRLAARCDPLRTGTALEAVQDRAAGCDNPSYRYLRPLHASSARFPY